MTPPFDPTPRPALRKAADADVHPTTHVAPASTGDSVLEGKKVTIEARIPKKLRKQMRQVTKDSDITMDELVTIAVANEVRRRTN